jgi:hypothetical protein
VITTKEAVSTYVAAGAYALAALLFLFPILDALVAVVPMHPDEVAWRYNALDRLSHGVLPGLLGVLLAFCLALFLEQPRMVRAVGVVSGAWAVVLVGVALLFIVAAADVRAGSLARDKTAFDVATTIAVVKYAGGVLIAIAFAAPAWQAARRIRHEAHLMTPDLVEPPQFVMRPHGTAF